VRLIGEGPAQLPAAAAEPVVIDEGQRLLRVAPAEILGARSAGNYVEFLLADGRRPLMRTTLSGVDETLAPRGFVRTHRSWLVNPAHVAQIEAEGSGDFGLTLGDGTHVPLSRRYRQAMESLRGRG
jgi:DNA-binding LytR/AlgR family response regulator